MRDCQMLRDYAKRVKSSDPEKAKAAKAFALNLYQFADAATDRTEAEWMDAEVTAKFKAQGQELKSQAEALGLDVVQDILNEQERVYSQIQYSYVRQALGM